ncbi:MAG: tetratricopeptide (TPR) repeat protein [Granulosicoccus sp.]|jgi:tetratricopeptide (TPR) repeat protein
MISLWRKMRAQKLHNEAQRLSDNGHDEKAIEIYKSAIALDPSRSTSYYNIGLIYKYRNDWSASCKYNKIAYELDATDDASRWNFAIAATALGDWETSRRLWSDVGFTLDEDSSPIDMDFGITPIRLNPDSDGEVVWARRIDPVRARLENIPFPESGYRYGDVVLHDGAPVGERVYNDQTYPVFNCLELLEPSADSTYVLIVRAPNGIAMKTLDSELENSGIHLEDWTSTVRALCRQCSEGLPHETHDSELDSGQWIEERKCGLTTNIQDISELVATASETAHVDILQLECHLTRTASTNN